jgi:hypothetical protein
MEPVAFRRDIKDTVRLTERSGLTKQAHSGSVWEQEVPKMMVELGQRSIPFNSRSTVSGFGL